MWNTYSPKNFQFLNDLVNLFTAQNWLKLGPQIPTHVMAAIFGEVTFDPSTHALTMTLDHTSDKAMKVEAYISYYVPYFFRTRARHIRGLVSKYM